MALRVSRCRPVADLFSVLLLAAAVAVPAFPLAAERPAGDDEIPLRPWQAPPFWSAPPPAAEKVSSARGIPTETSAVSSSAPLPFVAITPCRLIDTRAASGFPAGYGPPSLPGVHTQRDFTVTGKCGIPADAQAVSFNFTVWAPVTRGDIRVFPAGIPAPTVATLNWEANIQALANAAVVPLGVGGAITVQVDGPGTIDLIADVNGYYSPLGVVNTISGLSGDVTLSAGSNVTITPGGQTLTISTGGAGGVLPPGVFGQTLRFNGTSWEGSNVLVSYASVVQVEGTLSVWNTAGWGINAVSTDSDAVHGHAIAANKAGVKGESDSDSGSGVYGVSTFGKGVWGASVSSTGVHGSSTTGSGVRGEVSGFGASGVVGYSSVASGLTRGVYGQADSSGGRGIEGYSGPGIAVYGFSPSGYAFYCNGNGVYTGSWGPLSDFRLKRDVEPLADGLEKVLGLEAVSFRYRTEEFPERNLAEGPQIGLVAQDVQPVMPGVVVAGPDGYLSVDYAKLTPILIEAVKAQQRQIEALKARVDRLEGR